MEMMFAREILWRRVTGCEEGVVLVPGGGGGGGPVVKNSRRRGAPRMWRMGRRG